MIKFEAGTDAACIGLWKKDALPLIEGNFKYKEYEVELKKRSENSEIFYIDTLSDGTYKIGIIYETEPYSDLLKNYKKSDGYYSLKTDKDTFTFDGIEYLDKPDKSSYELEIPYILSELEIYEYNIPEGDEEDVMYEGLTDEEVSNYHSKSQGCTLFILIMLVGIIICFYTTFWLLILFFFFGSFVMNIIQKRNLKDEKYAKVENQINNWWDNHPNFVIYIKEVDQINKSDGSIEIKT